MNISDLFLPRRSVLAGIASIGFGASAWSAYAPGPSPSTIASERRPTRLIDVHSHAIFHIGVDPARPPQLPWTLEGALSIMDRHGISTSILSVPNSANFAEGPEATDIARRTNERIAEIIAKHPTRFGGFATLPGRNVDGILREIEYALDTLKLDGVATTTNINDVYLGDRRFDPWFEELHRRKAAMFIHATSLSFSNSMNLGMSDAMLEFMFDTTRMLANMLATESKKKFCDIKMISTHGGGAMSFLLDRFETLELISGTGKGRPVFSKAEIREVLSSFYYDLTALPSTLHLQSILRMVPKDRLLLGFDIPFMPESSIQATVDAVQSYPAFSPADIRAINSENALRLFPELAARIPGPPGG
ncbi:MAG: hypothetical protein JWR80_8268 [Bradyrhizobium sp.]|nr:hypothetical protein [Bradyrhizobium sp.]